MDPTTLIFVGVGVIYCLVIIKCTHDGEDVAAVPPVPERIPVPHYNTRISGQGIHIPAVARIHVPAPDIAPLRLPTPENIYEYKNITFKTLEDLGSGEWSVCSICLEPMLKGQNIQLLPCGHYYHNKCLSEWFIKKKLELCCPMCNCELNSGEN